MTLKPNPDAASELAKQPGYRRMLREHAQSVLRHAEAFAPRGKTGGVARSFQVNPAAQDDEVRVETTHPFSHLVEWGSVNNPPYSPLRRALRAAGLELKEEPK